MGRVRTALLGGVVLVALLAGCSSDDGEDTATTAADTAAPSSTSSTTSSDDGEGTSAAEVVAWQEALNAVGCDAGEPDGELGTATYDAMAHFQYAEGLPSDGRFSVESVAALEAAADDGRTVCTPENVPADDFGEPDCYEGIDEGCEPTDPSADPGDFGEPDCYEGIDEGCTSTDPSAS